MNITKRFLYPLFVLIQFAYPTFMHSMNCSAIIAQTKTQYESDKETAKILADVQASNGTLDVNSLNQRARELNSPVHFYIYDDAIMAQTKSESLDNKFRAVKILAQGNTRDGFLNEELLNQINMGLEASINYFPSFPYSNVEVKEAFSIKELILKVNKKFFESDELPQSLFDLNSKYDGACESRSENDLVIIHFNNDMDILKLVEIYKDANIDNVINITPRFFRDKEDRPFSTDESLVELKIIKDCMKFTFIFTNFTYVAYCTSNGNMITKFDMLGHNQKNRSCCSIS